MRSLATNMLRRPLRSSSFRSNSIATAAAILATTAVVIYEQSETSTRSAAATEPLAASFYPSATSLLESSSSSASTSSSLRKPASPTGTNATSSEPTAYPISIRAIKGYRVTMEDEYCVADSNRFAAIFDGHGGGRVSRYLRQTLWPTIQRELEQAKDEEEDESHASSISTYATALRRAFCKLDQRIQEDRSLRYQGSTAVAVWVHTATTATPTTNDDDGDTISYRTLLAANIGDSRAVLSRNGRAVDLTRDHKPNDVQERARLHAMGETIEWDRFAKVHRVRNLSLSRALGDVYARPAVSGDVELQHFPVQEESDEFVVLASDGLWDTMTSQEAVSFVHQQLAQATTTTTIVDPEKYRTVVRRHMSKYLTREALDRGSGDNICVVVIWLKD